MDRTLEHRVRRGMAHMDRVEPYWYSRTMAVLTSEDGANRYAQLVAQGGLFGQGERVRLMGFEWCVRMGLIPDPRGSYGAPVSMRQLDRMWRRLMVARAVR